ncbi:MAG: DUF642 domain-containing protein [Pseudomonadota bacterium]
MNRHLSLTALGLFLMSSSASANLIANGSFESGAHVNDSCNYMAVNPGSTALDGWDIGAQVAWGLDVCDGNGGSDGAGFVDLSSFGANSLGEISQALMLDIGTEYTLSFDSQGGAIDVTLNGDELVPTGAPGAGGYMTFTVIFTALETASVLSFANAAPGNPIVFLDNVILTAAPVPVPGALALFASAIGFTAFRRKA